MTQNHYERLSLGERNCFVRADGTTIQSNLCEFIGCTLMVVPQDYANGLPITLRNRIPFDTTSYYIPPDSIAIDSAREVSSQVVRPVIFFKLPPIQSPH